MELSLLLMKSLLVMGIMAAIGYASVKLGFLCFEDSKALSKLNVYIISSCMTLSAFQVDFNKDTLLGLAFTAVAAVVIQCVFMAVSEPIGKVFGLDGVEKASLIYTNAGNLIFPLVTELLGSEYLLYACSFRTIQLTLIWVRCPSMLMPGTKTSLKHLLKNPNIISIEVGLILFFTGLRVPGLLGTAVDKISNIVGPMCMLTIGVIMGNSEFKKIFTTPRYYLVTVGRLLLYPTIFILLCAVTGAYRILPDGQKLLLITLLACSTPSASNVAQMARIYGGDAEKAGVINIMTTVLAVATMPLMVMLYQTLCH